MKKLVFAVAQGFLVLVAILIVAFLLWEPHGEGVNAGKTFLAVYNDPFLWYVYLASIPVFVGLYNAFSIAGLARRGLAVSIQAAGALRTIALCAVIFVGSVIGTEILVFASPSDDRPPLIALGALAIAASVTVAVVATKLAAAVRQRLSR